eukprot:3688521-Rhodomonas_salina.1
MSALSCRCISRQKSLRLHARRASITFMLSVKMVAGTPNPTSSFSPRTASNIAATSARKEEHGPKTLHCCLDKEPSEHRMMAPAPMAPPALPSHAEHTWLLAAYIAPSCRDAQ